VGVVDEDHEAFRLRVGSQSLDDPTHQHERFGLRIVGPLGEGTERDRLAGGGGSDAAKLPPGLDRRRHASRASRDLPTPGLPDNATPRALSSAIMPLTSSIPCSDRPWASDRAHENISQSQ
jgi:hypothetical protein